ncbi:YeiH family protein [Maritalea sp.]|uniref:YeiH family protein n=1 Tax=Maritalea sp. TaxID=2003361 RepID=UPI003EF6C8BD
MTGLKHSVLNNWRGVLLCGAIAVVAIFLASNYGAPVMVFALLLGIAFNFVSPTGNIIGGVNFASSTLLKIGVALLGARITLSDVLALGPVPLIVVIVCLFSTIGVGVLVSTLFGRNKAFGLLTGGAVGICGASAALALTSILPKGKDGIGEQDTIFTVIAVTTLSTVAMVFYPLIIAYWGIEDQAAGVFLGATIHDVAQVVGAGYSISESVGDVSTIVKLFRVAMLVPVIAAISFFVFSSATGEPSVRKQFPMFLAWFVLLAALNSVGWIPQSVGSVLGELSKLALVMAIAGLGVKTSLKKLIEVGPVSMAIVVIETIWIALIAIVGLQFIG